MQMQECDVPCMIVFDAYDMVIIKATLNSYNGLTVLLECILLLKTDQESDLQEGRSVMNQT